MSHLADPTTAYVVAVIFLATLIRSTLGFGEALVAVPLLALRTPVAVAVPLAVLISIVVAAAIVVQDWRRIEFRSAGGLILSSLIGIPFGVLLLARTNDRVVKLILGTILVAFSIHSLIRSERRVRHDHPGWLVGCGFLGGILGGAYGMNGPPLAVYGALRGWSPQQFRATLQGYFLPVSVVGLMGYAYIGLWDGAITRYFLWSLPGVAAATLIGRSINERLRGTWFIRSVYAGLLIIGAVLLIQAA
jgi:uncharacterized membrane protein YfcA